MPEGGYVFNDTVVCPNGTAAFTVAEGSSTLPELAQNLPAGLLRQGPEPRGEGPSRREHLSTALGRLIQSTLVARALLISNAISLALVVRATWNRLDRLERRGRWLAGCMPLTPAASSKDSLPS